MEKKCMIIAALSFALVSLGQGFWNISEAQEKVVKREGDKSTEVRVIEEQGPAGHKTIGIDETSIVEGAGKTVALPFSTLMTWDYKVDVNTSPPEKLKRLDGRPVRITGFMFPLQEGKSIRFFCLLRTTQTCCYGPRPQFNQYVFVEMKKPTNFYRLDPVSCEGTFKVDPTPTEGFIYRMEGKECNSVSKKGRK